MTDGEAKAREGEDAVLKLQAAIREEVKPVPGHSLTRVIKDLEGFASAVRQSSDETRVVEAVAKLLRAHANARRLLMSSLEILRHEWRDATIRRIIGEEP